MRCEQARPLLLMGEHPEAHAHLATCSTCFTWLEEHDPVVDLLRAAHP